MNNTNAIEMQDVSVFYDDNKALDNVSIQVKVGEYVGMIGPNGGGKSTFLKALLGLVEPQEGSIRVFGKPPGELKKVIGYVPQHSDVDKNFPMTVHEVVITGLLPQGLKVFHRYSGADRKMVEIYLEKTGISHLKDRMISELSGGEFQRMLISRALITQPRLLLLDEATASIDAHSREDIYALLADLAPEVTIILVTHDMMAVSSHVESVACINQQLVYHGGKDIDQSVVDKLYGCPVDLIAHGVAHRVLRDHEQGEGS